MDHPQARSIVLLDKGEYIGTAAISGGRLPAFSHLGELISLYIRPAYWSCGYGRALLTAACGQLSEMGYSAVYLWVLEKNQRACRFYEACGFQRNGEILDDEIGGKMIREVQYVMLFPARE